MFSLELVLKFRGELSDRKEVISHNGIEISFQEYSQKNSENMWELLVSTHPDLSNELVTEESLSIEMKYSDVTDILKKNNSDNFRIIFQDNIRKIIFGNIPRYKVSRLYLESLVNDEDDADKWLKPFIDSNLLLQARLYDKDYHFWQNAYDPLQYTSNERNYKNLPMKSNGLPPPLKQQIIDTSNNPGRWDLNQGYIKCIGSMMWLNNQLLSSLNINKKKIESNSDWLRTIELKNGYLKLIAAETPFNSDKGTQRKTQLKLRKLLYNEEISDQKQSLWWPFRK